MRYANAYIKEYPGSEFVQVAVFNKLIVDDFAPRKVRSEEIKTDEFKAAEAQRIAHLRARHKIFDIALSNTWQYFCTFTFNDKIQNAYDYQDSINKVKKWTQNMVQRKGLRYLLVPELHPTSSRIHLHGLLAFGDSVPLQFSGHFDKSNRPIYNLPSWSYGFSTIIRLDDHTQDRIAKYITKYVTKELEKLTGNYYYAGGHDLVRDVESDYVNVSYEDFSGFETVIKGDFKVKYSLMTKEQAIKLQFIESDEIKF